MRPFQHFNGLLIAVFMLCASMPASGQSLGNTNAATTPLGIQFFLDPYMANPSFAGLDSGLHISIAYRKQWTDMPGSPQTKLLAANGYIGHRVGAGLQVYNDVAGLLSNTRVAGTYAYHLPLGDDNQHLNFGISGVFYSKYINAKDINGDPNDPSVGAFNRRDNYFESDFGISYTDSHWMVQAAVPNIFSVTREESRVVGTEKFIAGTGYKFFIGEEISFATPKVFYRNVYGHESVVDAGVQVGFLRNLFDVTGMYHSTGNFTAGAGIGWLPYVQLQFLYTSQTNGLRSYTNGTMELNLRVHLF
ncbi:type IX secretion system membrane protein, PorP/SprF family [Chitinophaga jiangningensis]|uniref:Type IX secretion system membrane protein, PorP/SprF family n=1 Tax=Chitinophaga jiangningensis TaxID=1419482 RepID=A0A1M6Z650_9BACT|nr:PorP/SprF family type IX secretion system membrane protein [Chitinophaga jiangningensis]SHL25933.1 type IX secretion system membrane protein, PorP/SprF family [Chitinophaga jiangningensis]